MNGPAAVPALLAGLAASLVVVALVPPPSRLAARVRPYTVEARSALGRPADVGGVVGSRRRGLVAHVFGTMLRRAADRVGRTIDGIGEEALALRVRRAGLHPDLGTDAERVTAYRIGQLGSLLGWGGGALVGALSLSLSTPQALAFVGLGLVVGGTRQRGRLERAIERRRERMRIEIYTVDQLLAMRIRAGGGVVQAVRALAERGRGEVIGELQEVVRLHRAGLRLGEAFDRVARTTPEPFCARTYALLATAEERGADLAAGLLALAEDVREARRESMRRSATRRRAAMLVPTIAVLAPVMLLFVGAPLPSLILGFR